jgi:hypothetical protein
MRAWLDNRRNGLTIDEQVAAFRMLEEEFWSEEVQKRLARDQANVAHLVERYELEKTSRRRTPENAISCKPVAGQSDREEPGAQEQRR